MLRNYLKVAWRGLRRRPGYTVINVLGLAVGIACCLLILLHVRSELSYDRFHEKAERIYRVNLEPAPSAGKDRPIAVTPNIAAPLLTRELAAVEKGVRLNRTSGAVQHEHQAFREDDFFYADSTFFDIFDFTFTAGRPATALTQPNAVVLTQSAAQRYFPDENPLGQTLTLDGDTSFEVTGVIEDVPTHSHLQFEFVASWSSLTGWVQQETWRSANFYTYVLLRPGTAAGRLQQRIDRLVEKRDSGTRALSLMPLTDLHLYADLAYALDPTGDIRYVWIFGALAVLVLLTACINYMNLATARASQRSEEVGMRKALGATRGALTQQFYGETALLVALALVSGLGLARLGLPLINVLSGASYALSDLPTGVLVGALAGIGLLVTLVAGSYPALLLSGFQPARVLKGSFETGRGEARFRQGLVVFQFAVAVFLIASTLVIRDQLDFLQSKNLGVDEEQVVTLPLDGGARRSARTLQNTFSQSPSVKYVSAVSEPPGDLGWTGRVDAPGLPSDEQITMKGFITDADITETLGLEIVAGRTFPGTLAAPDDSAGTGYRYLLNEAAVQTLGWAPREALGKRFSMSRRSGRVMGVVKNFHFASLRQSIEPMAIWYNPSSERHLLVRIAPGRTERALSHLEEQWSAVVPRQPFQYQFLDDTFDALYQSEQRVGRVFGAFALLAIFVACLGLLGLAAYAAEQRTKEIAVRKALGASVSSVIGLLSKDFLKLVGVAVLLAVPLAYVAMHQWLEDFAYRVELGPWIFTLAGAGALVVALLATGYQAWQAARTNPAQALRDE